MAVLKTARMGNEVLTQVATPIAEPSSPSVAQLAASMQETLEQIGVNGLAAPQVFVPKRLIVYCIPAYKIPTGARMSRIPWRALVNPELVPLTEERRPIGLERCVSIPGLHGEVPRWTKVRVRAHQLDGSPIEIVAAGYHARLLQHEIDHLDGILFPMRMTDLSKLGFNSERNDEDFVLRSPAEFQH